MDRNYESMKRMLEEGLELARLTNIPSETFRLWGMYRSFIGDQLVVVRNKNGRKVLPSIPQNGAIEELVLEYEPKFHYLEINQGEIVA